MTNAVTLASLANSGYLRNRIINGNMSIWQRGTTFSVTSGQYAQDRWFLFAPSGTFGSARSTDVPAGFQYSAELTGTNPSFTQRIEAANCFDLVGLSVTVSFWAKNVSGSQSLFVILQNPSAADNWSSITDFASTTVSASPSSSWTYYTATFNNLPAGVANGLGLAIGRAVGGATTTRVTGVQLEVGTQATPFEWRQYTTELQLCQRYFCKSYTNSTVPGTTTNDGCFEIYGLQNNSFHFIPVRFPVEMRAGPSVVVYNPTTGASGSMRRGANNVSAIIQDVGSAGGTVGNTSSGVSADAMFFHYTASIEL